MKSFKYPRQAFTNNYSNSNTNRNGNSGTSSNSNSNYNSNSKRHSKNKKHTVLIKSTAPWWVPSPSKAWAQAKQRKQSLSASFCNSLADLIRNISLHGYNKLLASELILWEKLIWLIVHAVTLFALLTSLALVWEEFVAQYVSISLYDPLYPVQKVPFPSVTICSDNRISRQMATLYAEKLHTHDPRNRSKEFYLERIDFFMSMYPAAQNKYNFDAFASFQSYLDNFGTTENETFFNTRRTMMELTPKCDDFIFKCLLSGVEIECFSNRAFEESLTLYGPCCTFNTRNVYKDRSYKDRFVDTDMGLTVVLNTSRLDDMATILNSDGYIVIIHGANIYPDIASGASREVFPTCGEESFVSISARIIDTVSELRSLGPINRKCYFNDESPDKEFIINGSYSFANCITRCRMKSTLALCNCVPFYMPLTLVNNTDGVIYCTLQHSSCLARYGLIITSSTLNIISVKWRNVLTQRSTLRGMDRALEEGLYCPLCMPMCDDVQYEVSVMSLPMDRYDGSLITTKINNETIKFEDMSVLRVHFNKPIAVYYRRMAGNSWFEAFSTVGNICSIFFGFSIVVGFEISYFLLKNIAVAMRKAKQQYNEEKNHQAQIQHDETKLFIIP